MDLDREGRRFIQLEYVGKAQKKTADEIEVFPFFKVPAVRSSGNLLPIPKELRVFP